jgi:hypothetical protein
MSYCTSPGWEEITMKLAVLAALVLVIGLGNATHAGCVDTPCTSDERTTTAPQAIDATLASRIDNALKDLEIANARALKADQERMNALCAAANCARPEPTKNPSGR